MDGQLEGVDVTENNLTQPLDIDDRDAPLQSLHVLPPSRSGENAFRNMVTLYI